ncbi:MAG: M28 family peptidase [Bacteroidota bacterium]|nr:M28 family peptidase [Bacteroidota bacterium]
MKKILFITAFLLLQLGLFSQDIEYARTIINDLSSEDMHGRGYVNAGDRKAAFYVENEFKKFNLFAFDTLIFKSKNHQRKLKKYTQEFTFKVNSFPGEIIINTGDRDALKPGIDYLVKPTSGSIEEKELLLIYLDKKVLKKEKNYDEFLSQDFTGCAVVIDLEEFKKFKEEENDYYFEIMDNYMRAEAMILLQEGNLVWGVGRTQDKYPTFIFKKEKFPEDLTKISVKVEHKFIKNYQSQNVVGMVKGKKYPDKYIIIGAHYDHLGRMGKDAYFPGANDNASGTAMMLDLAKHYSDVFNEPDYSIVFIAFGAEEAGLVGSHFFTENPYFPLDKVEFMINLDMMSTGETGMTVVNATKNKKEFNILKKLNIKKHYLTEIKERGPSKNSDHYFFHENGVKSIFLYLGGIPEKEYYYHHVKDLPSNISLAGYEGAFKLLTDFIEELQQ